VLVLTALALMPVSSAAQSDTVAEPESFARTPGGAFRRSAAFPGWGQYYNERPIKAIGYAGVFWFSMGVAVSNWDTAVGYDGPGSVFWSRRGWTHGRNNWLILAGFTYFLNLVDAYVDAHLQTFDVEPIARGAAAPDDAALFGVTLRFRPGSPASTRSSLRRY